MKALVTGASGFIGSTLVEELASQGFEVFTLMRKSSSASNLQGLKYQRLEGDLSNLDSLREALKKVPDLGYIFHLAGVTAGLNRDFYFEHNARGTATLAKAVSEVCPRLTRFVHISSLAAAGPADSLKPRLEDESNRPISAYGESKLEAETELLKYKNSFPIAIVRPPMVYGPRDKNFLVVVKTLVKNQMPLMPSDRADGNKYYSLIHAQDLSRGIVQLALAKNIPSGEIFYLADNETITNIQLLDAMVNRLGNKPFKFKMPKAILFMLGFLGTVFGKIFRKNFSLNLEKLKEIAPDYWICSNEKARKTFGFSPQIPLNSGMAETIDWYKSNKWI
jgi:nucleoside-diphosphate-sugar epimerase